MKHHEKPMGQCCSCIPLRLCVIAYTSLILFLSICAVLTFITEDPRILVGGYSYWANITVEVFGVFGVVLSLLSLVGLQEHNSRWVRYFAHYALVRIIARFCIFLSDFFTLQNCEHMGFSSMSGHYNAAVNMVVLGGRCPMARFFNYFISISDILISLYGVWTTYWWCYVVEEGPVYHITLDDTKAVSIHTGYSTIGHPEASGTAPLAPPTVKSAGAGYGTNAQYGHRLASQFSAYPAAPQTLPPSYAGAHASYGGYGYGHPSIASIPM